MIRLVDLGNNSERFVKPDELQTLKLSNTWLELIDPTNEELQAASKATEISINFLRLPKAHDVVSLRMEEGYGIINFPVMEDILSTRKTNSIIIAFTKNFLVTIAKREVQLIFNIVKERMSKTKIDPPSMVTYFIIDEAIANHYVQIEKLEDVTSKIEEEVVEKTASETLKRIFKLKANMVRFSKILWYERGVLFDLRKCGDICIVAKVRNLFDTTYEDITRQIDIVGTYREILTDAINVHLSATSNKINLSIQALTVIIFYLTIITTLTSFPNTVATFFGISQFGNTNIIAVLSAILASTILPFIWLWRKKWLKFPKI